MYDYDVTMSTLLSLNYTCGYLKSFTVLYLQKVPMFLISSFSSFRLEPPKILLLPPPPPPPMPSSTHRGESVLNRTWYYHDGKGPYYLHLSECLLPECLLDFFHDILGMLGVWVEGQGTVEKPDKMLYE